MYGNTAASPGADCATTASESPVVVSLNRLRRAQGFTHDVIEQLEARLSPLLSQPLPTNEKQGPQSVDSPPPSALCMEIGDRITTEENASSRLAGLLGRLTL